MIKINKTNFIQNLVWRFHGGTGEAELDNSMQSPTSDPSKSKSLQYIKSLLTDDANDLFTACSLVGGALQPNNKYYDQALNALENFSTFFVGNTNRYLFF